MDHNSQDPYVLLEIASRRIESAGIPPGRESNWALQRQYQAEWMVPALDALLPFAPCRVLDIGTGYGTFAVAAAMLGCEVVGIDWFTPLPAWRDPGITWLQVNVEADVPLVDPDVPGFAEPYDAVYMLEVLEHLNCHPLGLFRRIHDALRPGGLFYGSTPDPAVWQEDLPPIALEAMPQWHASAMPVDRHIRLYDPGDVTWLIASAGMQTDGMLRDGAPHSHWRATR